MRSRLFNRLSCLTLATMLYTAVGPQVCRAVMSADPGSREIMCCGEGQESAPEHGGPSDAHESCPLHKLSLIEFLPAESQSQVPDSPGTAMDTVMPPVGGFPGISPRPAVLFSHFHGASNHRSLFLVHRNLRR